MKKRISRRIIAVVLTLCMMMSLVTVSVVPASATASSTLLEKATGKLVDYGFRAAGKVTEVVADSSCGQGAEVASIINNLFFTDATGAALNEIQNMCEEILKELEKLDEIMDMITDIEYKMDEYSKTEISQAGVKASCDAWNEMGKIWERDVTAVYSSYHTEDAIKKYATYFLVSYLNYYGLPEDEAQKNALTDMYNRCTGGKINELDAKMFDDNAVVEAKNNFTESCKTIYNSAVSDDAYESAYVNNCFSNTIKELSENLVIGNSVTSVSSEQSYIEAVAVYAYETYPFSHQQYEVICGYAKKQMMQIVLAEMAYNEYLNLQGEYLNIKYGNDWDTQEIITTVNNNGTQGRNTSYAYLLNEYIGSGKTLEKATIECGNIFDAEMDITPKYKTTLSDYMRPEDVATVTLEIKDFQDSLNYSNRIFNNIFEMPDKKEHINKTIKFNRVMSGNNEEIYYILDPSQFEDSNNSLSTEILLGYASMHGHIIERGCAYESCDFTNLIKDMTDGVNTFSVPSKTEVSELNDLFATGAFDYYGNTPSAFLVEFGSDKSKSEQTYILTSSLQIDQYEDLVMFDFVNSSQTMTVNATVPEIKTVVVNGSSINPNAGSKFKGSSEYQVILTNNSDEYKQTLELDVNSQDIFEDAYIIAEDGTKISLSSSDVSVHSGDSITIYYKLNAGCQLDEIQCIRNNDTQTVTKLVDSSTSLTQDSNGYSSLTITMPYSSTTIKLSGSEVQPTEPSKNKDGVYQIKTDEELVWFSQYANSEDSSVCGVLKNDIVFDSKTSELWTPIGSTSRPYTGTFDGQGHTISNFVFDNSGKSYVGMFGYNKGIVRNIEMTNCYVNGYNDVGGVCGYNEGLIENVGFSGEVTGKNNVSGICGENVDGIITKCSSNGRVSGEYSVGGICGQMFRYRNTVPEISYCTNTATVTSECDWIGGICGNGDGNINNCYNSGNVTGKCYVGGVCGIFRNHTMSDCYNVGNISNGRYSDSICGDVLNNSGTIENCYYVGESETDRFEGTTFKSSEQFKSGEVTYLLNNGVTDGTQNWYQSIGTDDYPTLTSDISKTVYKNTDGTYSNAKEIIKGDVNNNGHVDVRDVTLIQKSIVGAETLDENQIQSADYNCDGVVNINDVTDIQKYIVES